MAEERVRYSDAELQEFKKIIQDKIAKAEKPMSVAEEMRKSLCCFMCLFLEHKNRNSTELGSWCLPRFSDVHCIRQQKIGYCC